MKNDRFKISENFTRTSSVKFDKSPKTLKAVAHLESLCPETTKAIDTIVFTLLVLRNKPFLYDEVEYKDTEAELRKLIVNPEANFALIKALGEEFYNYFADLTSARG